MEIAGEVTSSFLQTSQLNDALSSVSYDLIADVPPNTVKDAVGMSKTDLQPMPTQKLIDAGDLFDTVIVDQPDVLALSLSTDRFAGDRLAVQQFDGLYAQKDILVGLSVEAPLLNSVESDSLLQNTDVIGSLVNETDRFAELNQIDQLVNAARELGTIKDLDTLGLGAAPQAQDLLNAGLGNSGDRQPSLGRFPQNDPNAATNPNDSFGFDDPLSGHRNQRPASTVVGAGVSPTPDSLVSQQGGRRDREWSSADGLTTWGHTTLEDGSRAATRVDRHADGSYTRWAMVWGQDGRVESFGDAHFRASDGHTTHEYTLFENGVKVTRGYEEDENGVVVREWGSDFEKPNSGESNPKVNKGDITKYQPTEDVGGSTYNPFTGQYWGSEIKLSANQVNPNSDAPNLSNAPRLAINSRDLVTNPVMETSGGKAGYNPHRFDSRDRINPPRL